MEDHDQTTASVTRELAELKRLHRIGELFIADGRMREVLEEIVEAAIFISDADMGAMQLMDDSGNLRIVAHRGFQQSWLNFWDSVHKRQGSCGTALEAGKPVIVEDITQSPIFQNSPALDVQLSAGVRAVQSTPLIGRGGNVIGIISTHFKSTHRPDERTMQVLGLLARQSTDIIERARLEEGLLQSEEKYRLIFNNSPVGMMHFNPNGILTDCNDKFAETLGASKEQIIGFNLLTSLQNEEVKQAIRQALSGKVGTYEGEYTSVTGGRKRFGRITYAPLIVPGTESSGGIAIADDFTERKVAEDALRESEERFRLVAETITEVYWIADVETDLTVYVSPAYEQIWGQSCESLYENPKSFVDAIHEEDRERILTNLEVKKSGKPFEMEYRIIRPDGTVRWIWDRGFPVQGPSGEVTRYAGVAQDITRRKQAELDSQQSQQMLSSILSTSPVGISMAQGRTLIWVNQTWIDIFGFTDEKQVLGIKTRTLYPSGDEYERVGRLLFSDLKREKIAETDTIFVRADGSQFTGHIRAQIYGASGSEKTVTVAITDITERQRMETALRESEEKYRSLVENIPDVVWTTDENGNTAFISPNITRLFGYTPREIYESGPDLWFGRIHPDDLEQTREAYTRLFHEDDLYDVEYRIKTKNHDWIWIRDRAISTYSKNGIRYADGIFTDITDRKRSELALRSSEERFRTICEHGPFMIDAFDKQGRCIIWNKECERVFGWTLEEIQAHDDPLSLFYPDPEIRLKVLDLVTSTPDTTFHESHPHTRDGVELTCMWADFELPDGIIINLGYDITDRIIAERERENLKSQLLQSQKMEAVGTLAAGIAHDFNNMLQGILGYSEILLSKKRTGEPGYVELKRIVQTSLEAKDLVQKIRLFSRKADIQPVAVDLNHQLKELTKLLCHTFLKTVRLDVHLAENLGMIQADPALMDQMVTNLAINASEAMPDGGTLTIETQNILLEDEFCKSHVGAQPGAHVLLTISDTGTGMTRELVDRIFDPFFSTKQRDYRRGTGLGLSIVKGIVDEHSGYITVKSEVGKGTSFRIYFPVLTTQEIPKVETRVDLATTSGETILLVEDEELVRDLGIMLLEKFGYTVIAVADGQEALEAYAKHQENVALVILDIVMPRMDGKECLQELLKINPEVKVLISSGVAQDDRVKAVVKLGAKGSLLKPYGMKALQEKVREVLDGD